MSEIFYIDRSSRKKEVEQIYGIFFLKAVYGKYSRFLSAMFSKIPLFSHFYGWLQKKKSSRKKIQPFIDKFNVDASEFLEPISSFTSFNDFFIRKLKPECRPITCADVTLPADGRYLVYQDFSKCDGIFVKGKKFFLSKLLQNETLASNYANGSVMMARLCPVDYHRFHFPIDGIPGEAKLINGPLYSVNPIALRKNIAILQENKRMITPIETKNLGTILYIEVGATNVGSIHQTYTPGKPVKKGDEKGYFSFGGSSLILLFEPGKIVFAKDLIEATEQGLETKALFGQPLTS